MLTVDTKENKLYIQKQPTEESKEAVNLVSPLFAKFNFMLGTPTPSNESSSIGGIFTKQMAGNFKFADLLGDDI